MVTSFSINYFTYEQVFNDLSIFNGQNPNVIKKVLVAMVFASSESFRLYFYGENLQNIINDTNGSTEIDWQNAKNILVNWYLIVKKWKLVILLMLKNI